MTFFLARRIVRSGLLHAAAAPEGRDGSVSAPPIFLPKSKLAFRFGNLFETKQKKQPHDGSVAAFLFSIKPYQILLTALDKRETFLAQLFLW